MLNMAGSDVRFILDDGSSCSQLCVIDKNRGQFHSIQTNMGRQPRWFLQKYITNIVDKLKSKRTVWQHRY